MSFLILLLFSGAGAYAQSFNVLVVASRARDHQAMIAAARPFFERMAVGNDFRLDFTDDTSLIVPANLAHYQVLVMLQLAPFDMSYAQQAALQQFVEEGKGVVRVLASVDGSTYHPRRPMGDHPIIWANERYRRMIYIGPGHSPELLADHRYATLLRDAILWAASSGPAGFSILMEDDRVTWSRKYTLPLGPKQRELVQRLLDALSAGGLKITTADAETGTILGTGNMDVGNTDLRYNWVVSVHDRRYTFSATHFYEKPADHAGEYSKIEYRWWDFRLGHPWRPGDSALFTGLEQRIPKIMDDLYQRVNIPRWHVLALYENGGHHIEYTRRARSWLDNLAVDSNFSIDYLTHTDSITDDLLTHYQLILQLDYVPYGWRPVAMRAFQKYIEEGRGGWIGLHHASLLGEFDGYPMWPWFDTFMGGIRWKDYIARFAKATVVVEDHAHPVMNGIPDSFPVQKEEWYTYDKSPRPNVHVLAHVDESTYQPDTSIKMGDHPVIWTNDHVRARNVYIFMGHSPVLFDDSVYRRLFSNAISWAASAPPRPAPVFSDDHARFRALAFFSTTVEPDHVDFARDAIRWYAGLAQRRHFSLDTTSNWENCDSALQHYQVVIWLNDFPHTAAQRAAFERYMDGGGAWMGFHVSGYNDKDTRWPWFVRFLGGAVFYNNNWPPLPAKLIVDDNRHPATRRLPGRYTAPINEWYGWRPDPRDNKDVKVLATLDPANYPLGKKDILRSGDVPVVWTNTRYKMLYLNMGHGDQIFASAVQNRLFEDAIMWLGQVSPKKLYVPNFDSIWVKDQEPFRIAGNLYYVGSYDLASYLITTPKGHILINTGIPGSDTMIRRHVEALGFKFSDIKILLATHAHFDHVGAMAAVKRATGAQLMIEEKDAPLLEDGGNSDFDMGGHGPMWVPVKVDRRLQDKDIVKLGGMRIMVLHHPGHTKGASSFLFTVKDETRSYRVLIANMPTMLSETKFPSMPAYPEVGKDYGYTLDTMPRISFDIWLSSHGSQFDLQEKHLRARGYHPEAYMNDRRAYDSAISDLHAEYLKKMKP